MNQLDERCMTYIFECLNLPEILATVRSCHALHGAAYTSQTGNILVGDGMATRRRCNPTSKIRSYPANPVQYPPGLVRRPCDVTRLRALSLSTLWHHCTHLQNSLLDLSRAFRLRHLNLIGTTLTGLTTLHLAICEYPETDMLADHAILGGNLRNLQLYFHFLRVTEMQRVVAAIVNAPKLQTVKLHNLLTSMDLTPLTTLEDLSTLHLSFKTKLSKKNEEMLRPLSNLRCVRDLSINNGKLALKELELLPPLPPSIETFDLSETRLIKGQLAELLQRLPNLTALAPFGFRVKCLPQLAHFHRLRSITFDAGLWSSTTFDEETILLPLFACKTLTHIGFQTACIQTDHAWIALFDRIPTLTSLSLGSACPRSLSFLDVEPLRSQLLELELIDCNLDAAQFWFLLKQLPNLELCRIHLDAFPLVPSRTQFGALNTTRVWSKLLYLHLEAPFKRSRTSVRTFVWQKDGENADRYRVNH